MINASRLASEGAYGGRNRAHELGQAQQIPSDVESKGPAEGHVNLRCLPASCFLWGNAGGRVRAILECSSVGDILARTRAGPTSSMGCGEQRVTISYFNFPGSHIRV